MTKFSDLVIDVDHDETGRDYVTPDGRVMHDVKLTLTAEGADRIREGYMCGNCLEDVTRLGAFPLNCPVCNFEMRRLQTRMYERDFKGVERIGSSVSLSDELEKLKDLRL